VWFLNFIQQNNTMKNKLLLVFLCFLMVYAKSQNISKDLEDQYELDFSNFPKSTLQFWTRSTKPFTLNQIGFFENGKKNLPISINKVESSTRPIPRNKYVMILIQSHFLPKGIAQRSFFKNALAEGLNGKVNRGDKYIVATFDWYRDGKYISYVGGKEYSDDVDEILGRVNSITSPSFLKNTQKGSDIYAALDESLEFFSTIKDTLPKNILLFSDDFPNIVSSILPPDVAQRSLQLDIPIYGISFNVGSSRYNLVTQNDICTKTNGDYFLSENNDPSYAGQVVSTFLDKMNVNSLGISYLLKYTSALERTGDKVALSLEMKDLPVRKYDVNYPFNLIDWIKAKPLMFVVALLVLALLIFLIVIFFKRIKKSRELKRAKENEIDSKQALSQSEIQALRMQQQEMAVKHESEKAVLKKKLEEEELARKLQLQGIKNQVIYTFEGRSTVIPMNGIEFTVGRNPENDLKLDLPFISKYHLNLKFNIDGSFYLNDLNSTNGTLLNNVKVNRPSKLNNGDMISIGKVDIRFSQTKI